MVQLCSMVWYRMDKDTHGATPCATIIFPFVSAGQNGTKKLMVTFLAYTVLL